MAAIAGDRVAVQTKSLHAYDRMGTVQAVLAESPPRYQVRWDNGGWTIITSSALRVIPALANGKRRPHRRTAAPTKQR